MRLSETMEKFLGRLDWSDMDLAYFKKWTLIALIIGLISGISVILVQQFVQHVASVLISNFADQGRRSVPPRDHRILPRLQPPTGSSLWPRTNGNTCSWTGPIHRNQPLTCCFAFHECGSCERGLLRVLAI